MLEVGRQCDSKNASIGSIVDKEVLEENMRINCIPRSFSSMTVDDYDNFLKQRRKLMAEKIKDYYYSL